MRTTTSFLHLTARSGVRDVFSDGQIARWFECRAGLSEDPLRARWSAYSDVMGASARPMISAEELAAILGRPRRGFRDWFHQYVSADPTTDLAGTPTPTAIPSGFLPSGGLRDLARAAAASARAPVAAIRSRGLARRAFIGLAERQGIRDTPRIARACGITPRAVQVRRQRVSPAELDAAALCLGDPHLLARTYGPA